MTDSRIARNSSDMMPPPDLPLGYSQQPQQQENNNTQVDEAMGGGGYDMCTPMGHPPVPLNCYARRMGQSGSAMMEKMDQKKKIREQARKKDARGFLEAPPFLFSSTGGFRPNDKPPYDDATVPRIERHFRLAGWERSVQERVVEGVNYVDGQKYALRFIDKFKGSAAVKAFGALGREGSRADCPFVIRFFSAWGTEDDRLVLQFEPYLPIEKTKVAHDRMLEIFPPMFYQYLHALVFIHFHSHVVANICPAHLGIAANRRASIITDLSQARHLDSGNSSVQLSEEEMQYADPQRSPKDGSMRLSFTHTEKSDIYSLGASAYTIITQKKLPTDADKLEHVHTSGDIEKDLKASGKINDAIVEQLLLMLHPTPTDRPSAEEVLYKLRPDLLPPRPEPVCLPPQTERYVQTYCNDEICGVVKTKDEASPSHGRSQASQMLYDLPCTPQAMRDLAAEIDQDVADKAPGVNRVVGGERARLFVHEMGGGAGAGDGVGEPAHKKAHKEGGDGHN
ncbi:unnamed protein product [Vitrella brassicaformis CCMP3155]|uniref:Protein kinase domain-containing protein n=1 Tax=Vitrella brassicaformis (strain CCMP3155) TaxID=1169540 RepID=A0A0G4GVT8_VITBC|nr:unnamed protein product [Vitrella brassicaformis CCMP3155]|eukprot:CEM35073.1 unnamed protein product [Vitrella brassicaformis CCMP3155]